MREVAGIVETLAARLKECPQLLPEEVRYLSRQRRCASCGHLWLLHDNEGVLDCEIEGCRCNGGILRCEECDHDWGGWHKEFCSHYVMHAYRGVGIVMGDE